MFSDRFITISSFFMFFFFLSYVFSSTCLASTIELPSGTYVQLELAETVSSKTANIGDGIKFRVIADVKKSGKILIKGGTIASGVIMSVDKNGMIGKPGSLGVQLKSVPAIDGSLVPLSASKVIQGEDKQGTALVVTLVLCIFGLFIKGGDASLQAGSIFEAITTTDVNIEIE